MVERAERATSLACNIIYSVHRDRRHDFAEEENENLFGENVAGCVDARVIIVFRDYISPLWMAGEKDREREREREREQSDCLLAVAKELAVTTLRSDLLNFRRARAKRLREMESETVEGLVSAENAPVFPLISPVGRRFFLSFYASP